MIISTPASFRAYMQRMSEKYNLQFSYGDELQFIRLQHSLAEYPALWLEAPIVKVERSGNLKTILYTGFWLLTKPMHDDQPATLDEIDMLFQKGISILKTMQFDSEENEAFEFDMSGSEMEEKVYLTADDTCGWHISLTVILPGDECPENCDDDE